MLITVTLILMKSKAEIDIQVNPQQKIIDTLKIVKENQILPMPDLEEEIKVRSDRRRTYINPELTYEQASIYTGDRMMIE